MQTDWGMVLAILALVGTAIGAVAAVAQANGSLKQRVATLEKSDAEKDGELKVMQASLARGDTRFAVMDKRLEGMDEKLDGIRGVLDRIAPKG